jgi:putative heme-binding domain-containing protein
LAISSPNAEVREGFENYTVRTVDGQTITGFLADQDDNVIVLRPIGGQKVVLERDQIAKMESSGGSLMPGGLLADLDDKGIVDFFAYLRSTQPLNVN